MSENKLKPCPFCGGKAAFITRTHSSSHYASGFNFEIKCKDCGVQLPKSYKAEFGLTEDGGINPLHDEREQAVKDWNKRAGGDGENEEHAGRLEQLPV